MAGNDWKWLEMAGKGLKVLDMACWVVVVSSHIDCLCTKFCLFPYNKKIYLKLLFFETYLIIKCQTFDNK